MTAQAPTTATTALVDGPVTFKPAKKPLSQDVPNPMRGQYRWFGAAPMPTWTTARDVYYRDQVYWGRIEPSDNNFDFAWFEAGLAQAEAQGGVFSFRVMAYCPGCWMESRPDLPPVAPPFVPTHGGSHEPQWNNEVFLSQWEELMAELGERYGDNPYLGSVDIGGFGRYGEWHTDPAEHDIDKANAMRVIAAVATNFPDQHVLLNTMVPLDWTTDAIEAHPNLGLRTDGLGCPDMFSTIPMWPELQQVWKDRPLYSEWCTRASVIRGVRQIKRWHVSTLSSANMPFRFSNLTKSKKKAYLRALRTAGYRYRIDAVRFETALDAGGSVPVTVTLSNLGTAPTYEEWEPELVFVNTTTDVTVARPLTLDLRELRPGQHSSSHTVSLAGLTPGSWRVYLLVEAPLAEWEPMRLSNKGRDANGRYLLGTIGIS